MATLGMKRAALVAALLVVLALTPVQSSAQGAPLIVIYEGRDTVSTARYFKKFAQKRQALNVALANNNHPRLPATPRQSVSLASFFPIVTRSMHPGVPTVKRVAHLTQPIFLMGMDDQSLAWLRDNFNALRAMGAMGVVVNAPRYEQFAQLQANAAALGMALTAIAGEGLAAKYGVSAYPVLLMGF